MSTQVAQDLSVDAAYQVAQARVFEPMFFKKLAEAGIVPSSAQEAEYLLSIGQNLLLAEHRELQKKQASTSSIYALAATRLEQMVNNQSPSLHYFNDLEVKQAADIFLAQADVIKAAAVIQKDSLEGK